MVKYPHNIKFKSFRSIEFQKLFILPIENRWDNLNKIQHKFLYKNILLKKNIKNFEPVFGSMHFSEYIKLLTLKKKNNLLYYIHVCISIFNSFFIRRNIFYFLFLFFIILNTGEFFDSFIFNYFSSLFVLGNQLIEIH